MDTAFRQMDPNLPSGADFSNEHQAALRMRQN